MARKYRKIDPRIWSDERFKTLNEQEKLLALYCLTTPQGNRVGIFRLSLALSAEDLGWPIKTTERRYRHMCSHLRWVVDDTCSVLYLPTWWKYNEPENGSVLLGNLEDLHDVPRSQLVEHFASNMTYLATSYRVKVGKEWVDKNTLEMFQTSPHVLAHMSPTTETRVPHVVAQEQEQEQEQDIPPKPPRGQRFIPPTHDEVAAYCRERGNGIDAEQFIAHYQSKGWMVGRNPMKDWRAAVITFEKNQAKFGGSNPKPAPYVPVRAPEVPHRIPKVKTT